jgi:hypothetical protein
MSWVIDGSNVLGRLSDNARESIDAKRQLVQRLAQFARARRVRVVCYFDGAEPEFFGKVLGNATVIFSGGVPADELIVRKVAEGSGWKLVTSDRGLAARVAGRRVEIVEPHSFLGMLKETARQEADTEDWQAYFSDPKNRNVF